jgi:hypothetical protein
MFFCTSCYISKISEWKSIKFGIQCIHYTKSYKFNFVSHGNNSDPALLNPEMMSVILENVFGRKIFTT